ncbi:MAG: transglycosylase SLT domain-containing protein [Thermodesulfobacteriota bacterium]|nr:transglycosylase SLT domain-containing protein [Thermodesulfobacteriota bacterium]
MHTIRKRPNICFALFAFILIPAFCLVFPTNTRADLALLREIIIDYNTDVQEKCLLDDSYRGEEGILRIRPEVAHSFGLKAVMVQDYLHAMELYKRADEVLEKVVQAKRAREKETFSGQHVRAVADGALLYHTLIGCAQRLMKAYKSEVKARNDDRLNQGICSNLMQELLAETLKGASNNLRDALGHFYNRCQVLDEASGPLNPENVRFVNYVFHEFISKASDEVILQFDLGRQHERDENHRAGAIKDIIGASGSRFVSLLEPFIENYEDSVYPVDPLLFLALIRQESAFDPNNVSSVGAVGLTQIMPGTAKDLGMNNIFEPQYLNEAKSLMVRERRLKRKAMSLVMDINEQNRLEYAKRARELTQESIRCAESRRKLYAQYKQDLLTKGRDDRLDPAKAIEYGHKYFARMMKIQKGDMSLALASYNAGPHRVKQYNGIPPYAETVSFRNRVLKYYREYLRNLDKSQ